MAGRKLGLRRRRQCHRAGIQRRPTLQAISVT